MIEAGTSRDPPFWFFPPETYPPDVTGFIIPPLFQSMVVVFLMSLLVFVGVNVVGDPVDMLINPEADQAEIDRVIRHRCGAMISRGRKLLRYLHPSLRG